MAKLPVLQLTRLLQNTTGQQRFRATEVIDPVSEAIGQAGQVATGIADKMWEADSKVQLSAANTNTQMELAALEVELAKGNTETALQDYQVRAQEVYARNAEGMSPLVVAEYDSAFATINAKTNLSLTGTIAAKRSDERVGYTHSVLEWGLKQGASSPDPETRAMALAQGLSEIGDRIDANDISADEGAKMALKYRTDFMDTVMVGHINRVSLNDLDVIFEQMQKGDFGDDELNMVWSTLDEKRKGQLVSQAITNNQRYLVAQDAAERRKDATREKERNKQLKIFWSRESSEEEKRAAAAELRLNPETSVRDTRDMEDALSGVSTDFDDPIKLQVMQDRIARHPGGVTQADFDEFSFVAREALVGQLNNMRNTLFDRAVQMINSSTQFVFPSEMAKSLAEGLEGTEALESARRSVITELQIARDDARTSGEGFDAMAWVRERLDPKSNEVPSAATTKPNDAEVAMSKAREELAAQGVSTREEWIAKEETMRWMAGVESVALSYQTFLNQGIAAGYKTND